jgi:hypothetical protein
MDKILLLCRLVLTAQAELYYTKQLTKVSELVGASNLFSCSFIWFHLVLSKTMQARHLSLGRFQ